jgi:hypothetical protein
VAGREWDQSRSQETGGWKEDKCTLILLVITPTYFYVRAHFDDQHSSRLLQVTAETLVGMIGEMGFRRSWTLRKGAGGQMQEL